MYNGKHVHLAGCTGITRELCGETHEILKEMRRDHTVLQTIKCMWDSKCKANVGGTHWETMKERTGYVCQNAQGRARKNIKRKTEGRARGMNRK